MALVPASYQLSNTEIANLWLEIKKMDLVPKLGKPKIGRLPEWLTHAWLSAKTPSPIKTPSSANTTLLTKTLSSAKSSSSKTLVNTPQPLPALLEYSKRGRSVMDIVNAHLPFLLQPCAGPSKRKKSDFDTCEDAKRMQLKAEEDFEAIFKVLDEEECNEVVLGVFFSLNTNCFSLTIIQIGEKYYNFHINSKRGSFFDREGEEEANRDQLY